MLHLGIFMQLRDMLASLVTPVLYIGPIYATYLAGDLPFMSSRSLVDHILAQVEDWQGIRNHVAVSPSRSLLCWTRALSFDRGP